MKYCNPCGYYVGKINRLDEMFPSKKIIQQKLRPSDYHSLTMRHLMLQPQRKDIRSHGQSFERTQLLYNGYTE